MDKELDDKINEELDDETKKPLLEELSRLFAEKDQEDVHIYERFIATQNPNIDNTILEENGGDENKNSNNALNFLEKEKTAYYDKYNRTKLYLNFIKELIIQQINTIKTQTDAIFQNDPEIQKKQLQHNEKLKQYKNNIKKYNYNDQIKKLNESIEKYEDQINKLKVSINNNENKSDKETLYKLNLKLNKKKIEKCNLTNKRSRIKNEIKNTNEDYKRYLENAKYSMIETNTKDLYHLKGEIDNMLNTTNNLKIEFDKKFNKLQQFYDTLKIEQQEKLVKIIENKKTISDDNIDYSTLNKIKKMFNDIKRLRNKIGSQTANDVPEYIKNEKEIFFQSKIFNRKIRPILVQQNYNINIDGIFNRYNKFAEDLENKQYSIISLKEIIEKEVNKLQK